MSRELERWMFGDPARVVERIELQANAAVAREMEKLQIRLNKRALQERMHTKVFKKASAK